MRPKLAARPGLAPGPSMWALSPSQGLLPAPHRLPSRTHRSAPKGRTGSPPNAPRHLLLMFPQIPSSETHTSAFGLGPAGEQDFGAGGGHGSP